MLNEPVDMEQPFELRIWYHFINHGRSPAVITDVLHGFTIEDRVEKRQFLRVWENLMDTRSYDRWRESMDIIEIGKQSVQIEFIFDQKLSLKEAHAVAEKDAKEAFYFMGARFSTIRSGAVTRSNGNTCIAMAEAGN
jgi:hypothetical protein